jgi:hypothetical protein
MPAPCEPMKRFCMFVQRPMPPSFSEWLPIWCVKLLMNCAFRSSSRFWKAMWPPP